MRILLLAPLLLFAACADAPVDAAESSDSSGPAEQRAGPEGATPETAGTDEGQRADEAVAALLAAEPDLVFVGDWDCGDGAPFGSLSLGLDGEKGTYNAFLDSRPAGSGAWTFADETLTLDGTDGRSTFSHASVRGSTMSLTDDQGSEFTCKNVPISP